MFMDTSPACNCMQACKCEDIRAQDAQKIGLLAASAEPTSVSNYSSCSCCYCCCYCYSLRILFTLRWSLRLLRSARDGPALSAAAAACGRIGLKGHAPGQSELDGLNTPDGQPLALKLENLTALQKENPGRSLKSLLP